MKAEEGCWLKRPRWCVRVQSRQNGWQGPDNKTPRVAHTFRAVSHEARAGVRRKLLSLRQRTRPGSLRRRYRGELTCPLHLLAATLRTRDSSLAPMQGTLSEWKERAHRLPGSPQSRVDARTHAAPDFCRPRDRLRRVLLRPMQARAIPFGGRYDQDGRLRPAPKCYRRDSGLRARCKPKDKQESTSAQGSNPSRDAAEGGTPARR